MIFHLIHFIYLSLYLLCNYIFSVCQYNTFIFVLGVFLTDILHYTTAVHPRFSYFFITFINLSMISYL